MINPDLGHGFSTRSPGVETMLFMSTDAKLNVKEKVSEVILKLFPSLFLALALSLFQGGRGVKRGGGHEGGRR